MDRALARLARRGPDGSGVRSVAGDRALLGHRRLAIQDLSELAAQPMTTADGSLTIVYNGELYNAPELRRALEGCGRAFRTRSDTEVLLNALDEWGLAHTLDKLCGMFAFVAVQQSAGRTRAMAAVDPAGMKPLVYSGAADGLGGREVAFASDCDALRELLAEKPRIDPVGLRHVLALGYCPAPGTVWEGVNKLGPGTFLEWEVGGADEPQARVYWHPPTAPRCSRGDEPEEFAELIRRVSREHLIGDVPVGMFLSAGLDSASVALALRMAGADLGKIGAYTLSTDAPTDEAADAARLASGLGMAHRIVRFAPGELVPMVRRAAERYDEPQGYTALLTATRIADALRQAAPGVKVVLSGDGGDEAFGGYPWHREPATHPLSLGAFVPPGPSDLSEHRRLAAVVAKPKASAKERIAASHALGRLSFVHRSLTRAFGAFHPAEARALLGGLGGVYGEVEFAGWLMPADEPRLGHPRRAQRLDVLGFCAGSIQPKLDRACMGVGLELRAPYLDRRVLEWGLGLPVGPGESAPGGGKPTVRAMLTRGVEMGLVPREIMSRPKQGFSLKLGNEAFAGLDALVDESRLVRDGVLRRDWARYMTEDAESRRVRVFTLAMTAAWYETRT
jgi:asparagine synthase (glutamine-hydrolysing)